MPLAAGTRLGPYEILAPLGAGGMGEVYRARDPRFGRDVAIKVLPATFSRDTDRLRRFEHEIRAVGVLNHPNILSVYDTGSCDGAPYVVSELLEGQTLRGRMAGGPVSARKVIEIAVQLARGLAAAHEKGIVHRDLKPENLFITKDGRAKILDFGIAKLTQVASNGTEAETRTRETDPGTLVGTVGYMSPEQVRAEAVDHRSDIFSLGAILYEMVSGRRAFKRETTAETMTAILNEDPPELGSIASDMPPGLTRIVQHCLEKEPEERFQAARDLTFDLQSLSVSEPSVRTVVEPLPRRRAGVVAWLGLSILAATLGYFLATSSHRPASPRFQPLTFRRGHVTTARFMPDGQTIVYGAMWDGAPVQMFSVRLGAAESSPLSLPAGDVLSVSNSGELAVSLDSRFTQICMRSGRLARTPLSGAAPRVLLEDVQEAAWAPDGQRLLITRQAEGRSRLELGAGNILYETAGWISDARLSPNGAFVAFIDHPLVGWDYGSVAVVPATRGGQKRTLTPGSPCSLGLAWHPQGGEIWYTASGGWHQALFAVTLDGRVRTVLRIPGRLLLHDIDKQGRVLATSEYANIGTTYGHLGSTEERDLSWLEASVGTSLSADGQKVVINEQAEGGAYGSVYIRSLDGSPAVRLGSGLGGALSPDGTLVAALADEPPRILLIPTGAGEARSLLTPAKPMFAIAWLADGKGIVFAGFEEGQGMRLYSMSVPGGAPKSFTPEGFGDQFSIAVSQEGEWAATMGPGRRPYLCPLSGGEPVPLTGLDTGDRPMRFSSDGRWLYLSRPGGLSAQIARVDLRQRRREIWRDIHPRELEGMVWIQPMDVTPDGSRYLYWYWRVRSTLFLLDGVR